MPGLKFQARRSGNILRNPRNFDVIWYADARERLTSVRTVEHVGLTSDEINELWRREVTCGWLSDVRSRYLFKSTKTFPYLPEVFLSVSSTDATVPIARAIGSHTRDSAVPHKWTIKFYQSCCQFQNVDWYSSCCVARTQAEVGESATNASSLGCIICLDVSSHTLRRYILRIQRCTRVDARLTFSSPPAFPFCSMEKRYAAELLIKSCCF